MTEPTPDPTGATVPLDALLELSRSAGEDTVRGVLESVAHTIFQVAGFGVVVLNVYRPQWDDFEAVLVVGDQKGRDVLIGSTAPREVLERLLAEGQRRAANTFFLPEGVSTAWDELCVYTPDLIRSQAPDAWRPEDALLAVLRDTDGEPLGFVSMDEPGSGRRPSDPELHLLGVICSYAEQALRTARRAKATEEDNRVLARLSELSPHLSSCGSREQLFAAMVEAIGRDFGFERAAIYLPVASGELCLAAGSHAGPAVPAPAWAAGLTPADQRSGCWLLTTDADAQPRSSRNGKGPHAWRDHRLAIPWNRDEALHGLVIVDDPSDRLLPSDQRLRSLRLLVELAATVLHGIEQRGRLDHLASHDALTGVRNRRDFDRTITQPDGVALVLCDLDHFKAINDRHGHHVGDQVLAGFGELLAAAARTDDIPFRLGGEEFCLVLPHTDVAGALAVAERLRRATSERFNDIVPGGVTVSIGVSVTDRRTVDAHALLSAADRRLYHAKQAGRDRVVAESPAAALDLVVRGVGDTVRQVPPA